MAIRKFSILVIRGLVAGACVVGIVILIRLFGVESFQISTNAMAETLRKGDRILVDKLMGGRTPGRNRVVLFTSPLAKDSTDAPLFISRCIGMPGDTILKYLFRDNRHLRDLGSFRPEIEHHPARPPARTVRLYIYPDGFRGVPTTGGTIGRGEPTLRKRAHTGISINRTQERPRLPAGRGRPDRMQRNHPGRDRRKSPFPKRETIHRRTGNELFLLPPGLLLDAFR